MSLPIVHCLTRRRWLFFTATVFALSYVPPVPAQAQKGRLKQIENSTELEAGSTELDKSSSESDFFTLYAKAYPDRKARYFSNRKIVWIEQTFNPVPAIKMGFDEPLQQSRVDYLANNHQAKLEMVISNNQAFDVHPQIAKVITPVDQLCLRWNDKQKRYEYRSDFKLKYPPDTLHQSQMGIPFPMKLNDYDVMLEDLNPNLHNGLKELATVDAIAMEPCQWQGKALMRVTFRTAKSLLKDDPKTPIRTHHGYFDPHHAWICYGMEAEPLTIDSVPEVKKYVNRFVYEDGKEGYPYPVRFTKEVEYQDGTIIPIFELKIQSFERAYPEDEEVTLERIGLTPTDNDSNDLAQKYGDHFPFLNQGLWKWIIPLGILLVVIGAMIGKFASKSINQETSEQVPLPEY